ncbi:unnamed protein product [Lactuca saligna]|uniref:Uncharacterized protein n=1 Tax=Lactuca saligna TaxID=75948 RepID=A0AA36EA05_LACSI|nr:unnamed protein product [Lactuca saligna]
MYTEIELLSTECKVAFDKGLNFKKTAIMIFIINKEAIKKVLNVHSMEQKVVLFFFSSYGAFFLEFGAIIICVGYVLLLFQHPACCFLSVVVGKFLEQIWILGMMLPKVKNGIIDPLKVIRTALVDAARLVKQKQMFGVNLQFIWYKKNIEDYGPVVLSPLRSNTGKTS